MTLTVKEKELLYKALDLYSQECFKAYDFEKDSKLQFSEEFEEKMQRLIRRQRKPYYRLINTAAKRVACIIAALLIAAAGTVLSVDALREGVKNFFVEAYEKFSKVYFEKNDNLTNEIEVYYQPCYIPEGYKKSWSQKDKTSYYVTYTNEEGIEINYFQLCKSGAGINIDTEDAVTEEIGGGLFVHKEKANRSAFYFSDEKYFYEIVAYEGVSKEELIKIAESIKLQEE